MNLKWFTRKSPKVEWTDYKAEWLRVEYISPDFKYVYLYGSNGKDYRIPLEEVTK